VSLDVRVSDGLKFLRNQLFEDPTGDGHSET
jgi:hypothetical protein